MPSDSIVRGCTNGPVKLFGVWIGLDLQMDRNWGKMMSKVVNLKQKWAERKLSSKG